MDFYTELFALLVAGAFAGTLAGLLGVGGGLIIVPVLVWLYQNQPSIPAEHLMHVAVGTSLATIIFTAISSIYAHHRRGAVQWNIMQQLLPGIAVGAIFGAFVADMLPSVILKTIFALFILLVALNLFMNTPPQPHRQLPVWYGITAMGFVIASISAVVGIGGGTLTVPFLTWCNVTMRHAVATSAACGLPIAIFGAVGFIITGWNTPNLPAWSLGYIYLPALLIIVTTSLLFAPFGAKLAHTLPTHALKRFFAVFLLLVGIKMLLN